MSGTPYTVHGYKGKQVRDVIHSADLVRAFECVYERPRVGQVYNIGGGRQANVSVLEAIALAQEIAGRELSHAYSDTSRVGDHLWWVGSNGRFVAHYPEWRPTYDVRRILEEMRDENGERWAPS